MKKFLRRLAYLLGIKKPKMEVKAIKTENGLQIQYPTYEEFEDAMINHKSFKL